MTTDARQQFEKWAKDHGSDLRRAYDPDENRRVYVDNFVEDDWEMWQAARLSGLQQAAEIAATIAKAVGGKFADTHMLNTGLNKFLHSIWEQIAEQEDAK